MSEQGEHTVYNSGEDYTFGYGPMVMNFEDTDFRERAELAARRLKLIQAPLDENELDDLVELVVSADTRKLRSPFGDHIVNHRQEFFRGYNTGKSALVVCLRRSIFRTAWYDAGVMSGELDVVFDAETGDFNYVNIEGPDRTVIKLSPEPSWEQVAYPPQQ